MRLSGSPHNGRSPLITALLVFIVLIAVVQMASRQEQSRSLEDQFAARRPEPGAGAIQLPPVPTNLAALARTTTARILGGQRSAPLNSVGRNEAIEIHIDSITPENGALHIAGSVVNIGTAPVPISLDAFKFTDETGTVYASSGGPTTTLPAGQRAPLDITLPIASPTQLKLNVALINQSPIEMILLNAAPTPAP